jgi:hypothetical protein
VFDRADPAKRLTVEVVGQAGRRLTVLADRYRADVHQHGVGDGHYGFSVPVRDLGDETAVRIFCTDPHVELVKADGGKSRKTEAAKPRTFRRGSYTLQIDGPIRPGPIRGWAMDTSRPHLRRVLRLRRDGQFVEQQRATLYRSELANGERDGYHGFSFFVPSGTTRAIAVEDVEAGLAFLIQL